MSESSVKGKLGENVIIGKFLQKGFDVYLPVVDKGVDCVIKGNSGQFYEIQIKTRTTEGRGREQFFVRNFEPRERFFVACYMAQTGHEEIYIIPSMDFEKRSQKATKGRIRLVLTGRKREELKEYRDNFDQFP